ncbi:hypothetical protein GCM10009545_08420 [Saccharopolyspora thermophila]|uniref:Uncharacterized protein n=1 Tax=Saccharopolyspora thermophila TaxID=89367 RepID=A0ABN1BZM9_9PSEU
MRRRAANSGLLCAAAQVSASIPDPDLLWSVALTALLPQHKAPPRVTGREPADQFNAGTLRISTTAVKARWEYAS